tara:strand:- start:1317 stop:1820 length:504 start_codon:yes stop_codon:yes gene_type:complete
MVKKNKNSQNIIESNIAKASLKSVKTSPQKANLVLDLIRGQNAESAINSLEFSTRRVSNEIKKVLKAAISNAENNHQLDIDKLIVSEAYAGKSMVMKRFRPRARGRSGKILKPYSNIKIVLKERTNEKIEEKSKVKKKKLETKRNDDKTKNQNLITTSKEIKDGSKS